MTTTVTVNDLLDDHVALDIECLDRIYLNGYLPNLQVGGQVVSFMTQHLGYRIPSPAIMEKIGPAFRRAVKGFAEATQSPVARSNRTTGIWSASANAFTARRKAVPIFAMIAGDGMR